MNVDAARGEDGFIPDPGIGFSFIQIYANRAKKQIGPDFRRKSDYPKIRFPFSPVNK
jgi:hypothetical protein